MLQFKDFIPFLESIGCKNNRVKFYILEGSNLRPTSLEEYPWQDFDENKYEFCIHFDWDGKKGTLAIKNEICRLYQFGRESNYNHEWMMFLKKYQPEIYKNILIKHKQNVIKNISAKTDRNFPIKRQKLEDEVNALLNL